MNKKFTFGIYPGGIVGTDSSEELTVGNPDNAGKIVQALDTLQNKKSAFWIRCYLGYTGNGSSNNHNPKDPELYLTNGRKMDLVIGYHSMLLDIEHYELFIRSQIRLYKDKLAKVQITEEPNLHGVPVVDGDIPGVREALIRGVIAAKEESRKLNLPLLVGFNAVPTFDNLNDFWRDLASKAPPAFYHSLDYVGLDFFPDVFHPLSIEKMEEGIKMALHHFRNINLKEAKIPAEIPIHITENGWPTSSHRSEQMQAVVLEKIIRVIYEARIFFNIEAYELFSLRDSDSANPNIFHQFGIMRDEYMPKIAFDIFKSLVYTLGT